jgi:acyl-CoA synthetase (AMP-forming)/AMP-acid ligase II
LVRFEIMSDDGRILPRGSVGEIVLRGGLVMAGYYKNPQATAEASTFGRHHTGDIGVPDEKWGEAVKAVVELKPGAEASAAELIQLAKDKLGGVKAPKSVDFMASLPRSPVGKVLKKDLRAPYWAGRERKI